MIRGTANARRAGVVRLRVRGPAGHEIVVAAVIDTGFTGHLTLSATAIARLGLPKAVSRPVTLGDGASRQLDVYDAEVEWDGRWRSVVAYAVERDALAGLRLLADHPLRFDVRPGGAVEITPLR